MTDYLESMDLDIELSELESNSFLEQLDYDIFLAESDYFNNNIILGSKVVNESVGLLLLTESFKDNIKSFLTKMVKAIQNAWETFKAKIVQAPFKKYLARIKPLVEKFEGEVPVENFPVLDVDKVDSVKLIEYSPDMIGKYDSKAKLTKDMCTNVPQNDDSSFKNHVYNYLNSEKVTGNVAGDQIRLVYNNVTEGFPKSIDNLQNQLKKFNEESKKIEASIGAEENNIAQQGTTINNQPATAVGGQEITGEMAAIFESYLMEAPVTPPPKPNPTNNPNPAAGAKKAEDPKASSNTKVSPGPGGATGQNTQKTITMLISANTDIISAKMMYLRNCYMWGIKLLRGLFVVDNKGNEKEGKAKTKVNKTETKDTTIKI